MKAIREFSDWFFKQKPGGKFVIGLAGIVILFCVGGGIFSMLARSSQSPKLPPTLTFQPGLSPTALFNFGVETFTPFPTLSASTAVPTLTSPPTQTPAATQTQNSTSIPDVPLTPTNTPGNTPATNAGLVSIVSVNKVSEYVDIQNGGTAPVDLSGWVLVSEKGHQPCDLQGVLQPGEALRIWAGTNSSGLSCGYAEHIWNDNDADDAVLYNPQRKEVSRFP